MLDFSTESRLSASFRPPALHVNRSGKSPFLLVCDHACNFIPSPFKDLGLSSENRLGHIAWDPGALAVSHALCSLLDAQLVHSTNSRLLADPNRAPDSEALLPALNDGIAISGNAGLSPAARADRIALFHAPFHDLLDQVIESRLARGLETILIAIHTFTPRMSGLDRPWHAGLMHGQSEQLARAVYEHLTAGNPLLHIGWNEPYAAVNGLNYTLERHGDVRGLANVLIEIRSDEVLLPRDVTRWANLLSQSLLNEVGAPASHA